VNENPYIDVPRKRGEVKALVRRIMSDWPETENYHVIVGGDPMDFGLPMQSPYDGWSTIYPTKKILYVTGMQYWQTPAIMALVSHEIGHIVGGHSGGESEIQLENHLHEYYADEFAFENVKNFYGFVPASAGLWLLRGYVDWFWELEGLTHPCNRDRWERLALNGYVPSDYRLHLQALGLDTNEGDRYDSLINHGGE